MKEVPTIVISLAIGFVAGYAIKVESKTRTIVKEVQPACEHKFRSLSCVITGDTSQTANVIQECEKCGKVDRTKLYL